MKTICRSFLWGTDSETGNTGWLPDGIPEFWACTDGRLVAHDTLEHLTDRAGAEGELMALGVCQYIRIEGDYFSNFTKGKIPELEYDVSFALNSAGEHLAPAESILEIEEELTLLAEKGLTIYNGEQEEGEEVSTDLVPAIAYWLQRGYNAAKETYGDWPQWRLGELFNTVVVEVDTKMKNREEGDKLTVSANLETLEVSIVLESIFDMIEGEENEE